MTPAARNWHEVRTGRREPLRIGNRQFCGQAAARTGLLCLALSVLVGCTDPNKPDLELVCALKKCTCVSDADGYFARNFGTQTTAEVLWTDTGNAYCPEDFSLQQVDEKRGGYQYYTP